MPLLAAWPPLICWTSVWIMCWTTLVTLLSLQTCLNVGRLLGIDFTKFALHAVLAHHELGSTHGNNCVHNNLRCMAHLAKDDGPA